MKYRAEVDGLRAVAVIPVILFHAGIDIFKGGFIGVDVFFVISGYLITSNIIQDMESGGFRFSEFYERRARRILPPLFVVALCCLPFSWVLMTPPQMEDFSQSLVALGLFGTNILFWLESGYFEASSEQKPLLHTWSLAVEEQFYLLFPLLFLFAWKFSRKVFLYLVTLLILLSLLVSELGWRNYPSANFYLAPSRVWELMAGVLVALLMHCAPIKSNNPLSMLGGVLVVVPIFLFTESTPAPSIYTAVPVLGTALLLAFGGAGTLCAKVLSLRPLVFIGLISYSAYLWHQPIFAFAKIYSPDKPAVSSMLVLSGVSVVLAYLTWKHLELPFRIRVNGKYTSRQIWLFSGIGLLFFITAGMVGILSKGFEYRLTPEQKTLMNFSFYARAVPYREGTCFLTPDQTASDFPPHCSNNKRAVVWGDSHAAALSSGWLTAGEKVSLFSASLCPPLRGLDVPVRPNCKSINEAIIGNIRSASFGRVYLHADWKQHKGILENTLRESIRAIRNHSSSAITIVGGVPQYSPSLPTVLLNHRGTLTEHTTTQTNVDSIVEVDALLRGVAKSEGVGFISIVDAICKEGRCRSVVSSGSSNIEPMMWDYGHLTESGSKYITNLVSNNKE